MKKKWLCLLVLVALLIGTVTGMGDREAERVLARTLTATGGACGEDALMALGSAALNRAGGTDLKSLLAVLRTAPYRREAPASPRAVAAARRLFAGERTLPLTLDQVSAAPVDTPCERVGAFYFY